MKEFNKRKFRKDLIALRGKESQTSFAPKIGLSRYTLSLLENGKKIPSSDIYCRICKILEKKTDEYFTESQPDSLMYLMEKLKKEDKEKMGELSECIRIKEKYELLAKRGNHVID